MKVSPDSTIRLAPSEATTLALDSSLEPTQVRLAPRFGEGRVLALEDGGFAFPSLEAPDAVTLEWLDSEGTRLATSYTLVVSRHYFTLGELRGYGDGQDDFSALSEEALWSARQAATEVFEENANRSFVRQLGSTETYRGGFVWLDHNDVYELVTDGWSLASDCQAVGPRGHATIEYKYGLADVPARVSDAVLQLAAYYLRPEATPARATGEATEAGFIRYTLAGRDGATGLPEVDAIIEQFGRRGAMVL